LRIVDVVHTPEGIAIAGESEAADAEDARNVHFGVSKEHSSGELIVKHDWLMADASAQEPPLLVPVAVLRMTVQFAFVQWLISTAQLARPQP
jgi:hypothetical protein